MAKQDILIKQAKDLLDGMKTSRKNFVRKTSKIIKDADKTAKELSKMDLDKNLGKLEKESVKEMDKAVLDFLSEEEK